MPAHAGKPGQGNGYGNGNGNGGGNVSLGGCSVTDLPVSATGCLGNVGGNKVAACYYGSGIVAGLVAVGLVARRRV